MTTETLIAICGHSVEVPTRGLSLRRKSVEANLCKKCRDAEAQEKLTVAKKDLEKILSTLALPNLEGSEKQIAWAEEIRESFIQYIGKVFTGEEIVLSGNLIKENPQDAFERMIKERSASRWIEERATSPLAIAIHGWA